MLAALVLAFAATTVKAQDSGWYLEGSVGFNNTKIDVGAPDDAKITSFYILPTINYMLNSNWAIGLGIGYEYAKSNTDGDQIFADDVKRNMFYVAPQVTHIVPLGDKFSYTPGLRIGFGFGKDKIGDAENDITEIEAAISPLSFEFRPVSRWGINFSAGDLSYTYAKTKYDGGGDVKSNSFNFDFNVGATVGFRYYF